MTLAQKIVLLYPELDGQPLHFQAIVVQNDSNGKGDYIAEWNHSTLPKPTKEQLA